MSDIILKLENITKSFGDVNVLNGIDLEVERGEFITLLGSSGCGKTTLLRIIAGLEVCDGGRVILEGEDVTYAEPNRRDVNTVFQSYALFPHMTVAENIAYGLKLRKVAKNEINECVDEALNLVRLSGFGKRLPSELSGGQRQRAAIARAIINRPKVLLLDEPLGALDLNLRHDMQIELKKLQKQLGITFIYITHDQEEAINMSDRIAVVNKGVFEQLATPTDIYDNPKTAYVAKFVGSANIINGTAEIINGKPHISAEGVLLPIREDTNAACGEKITVAVRRENVILKTEGEGIPATVTDKLFAAGMLRITVSTESNTEITAVSHGINSDLAIGDKVIVSWQGKWAVPVLSEEQNG